MSNQPRAYPKTSRLLTPANFQQVFDAVDLKQGSSHFTLLAHRACRQQHRLGIIIAKRNVRRAVDRNRVKRVIRESFREHVASVNQQGKDAVVCTESEANDMQTMDIIVLAKAICADTGNQQLRQVLDKQWKNLSAKFSQHR